MTLPRAVLCSLLLAACGPQLVVLAPVRTLPVRPEAARQTLEVIGSASGDADPLAVNGLNLAFDGVPRAIAEYAAAVATPWATRHRQSRPAGWEMSIELIRGQADAVEGHLTVALETRVTVRTKAAHEHLGQTSAYCKISEALADHEPARIVYLCIEQMSRDIANWLEGVQP